MDTSFSKLLKSGKYRQAVSAYELLLEKDPQNASIRKDLAYSLYQVGRFDQARDEAQRAIQLDPSLGEPHVTLGMLSYRQEDYKASEEEALKALELEPDLASAHYLMGIIRLAQKRYKEGLSFLRQSVQLAPEHWQAHLALSYTFLVSKDSQNALMAAWKGYQLHRSVKSLAYWMAALEFQYGKIYWVIAGAFVLAGIAKLYYLAVSLLGILAGWQIVFGFFMVAITPKLGIGKIGVGMILAIMVVLFTVMRG